LEHYQLSEDAHEFDKILLSANSPSSYRGFAGFEFVPLPSSFRLDLLRLLVPYYA
jgi:hypothetical protein